MTYRTQIIVLKQLVEWLKFMYSIEYTEQPVSVEDALKHNLLCTPFSIFTELLVVILETDHHTYIFQVGYQSHLIFLNVSHSYLLIRQPQ